MIELHWQKIGDADALSVVLRCGHAGCPRSIGHLNAVLARADATTLGWLCLVDGPDLCPRHRGDAPVIAPTDEMTQPP